MSVRRVVCPLLCSLFVATLLLPASVSGQDRRTARAVNRILDEFETSALEEDLSTLREMISDEWHMTMPAPNDPSSAILLSKDQYLRIVERQFDQFDYTEKRHVDREIDINGPVATSVSTLISQTTAGFDGEDRIMHMYARVGGEWLLVFSTMLARD